MKKLNIFRVVTSADAVNFHLRNTLLLSTEDAITVIGKDVACLQSNFPHVAFINVSIEREINFLSDLKALFTLAFLFFRNKPDVVHSIMPKAGLLSAIAGFITRVPVRVHTFTGQKWASERGAKRTLLISLDKLIVKLNTICLTDSASQSEFLWKHNIHQNKRPLPTVGRGSLSGVDLDRFNSATIAPSKDRVRSSFDISPRDIVYIFLGRKCEDKGLVELINSFRKLNQKLPATKLLLVGPDEAKGSTLKNLLQTLPTNIINLPATFAPEIYLNAADIFCIPSYREGFGTVVIEAGALGLACVGTKIPGLSDSIQDGVTGLLVEPKDENSLYIAMRSLAKNPVLRKTLSDNALAYVRKYYDSKNIYKELRLLYLSLYC